MEEGIIRQFNLTPVRTLLSLDFQIDLNDCQKKAREVAIVILRKSIRWAQDHGLKLI